jgi:hypothetical protein
MVEQHSMKKLLFILLFSSSLSAAEYIAYNHPYYYFALDNKILACQPNKDGAICFSKSNDITIRYTCKAVTEAEGYLKDCKTKPAI